jgi:hypothetical protein
MNSYWVINHDLVAVEQTPQLICDLFAARSASNVSSPLAISSCDPLHLGPATKSSSAVQCSNHVHSADAVLGCRRMGHGARQIRCSEPDLAAGLVCRARVLHN